jgi:hypothetical protein
MAMTDSYIDSHFADIINHGSDIEARGDESDCTIDWIKDANNAFIKQFQQEQIILIDDDYEKVLESIVDNY